MISVIIPVYNSLPDLRRCIDCVLGQTYSDLEILLVDDGSTDGSGELCDEYAKADSRIRVVHQQNAGVSEARNTGLRMVSGDYVAFIDNDDWIHPQMFEVLHKAVVESGSDMSMCYYKKVWNDNFTPDAEPCDSAVQYIPMSRESMMGAMLAIPIDKTRMSPVPYEFIWGKLYRRNIVEGLFYRNVWGEDVEYNSRLYIRAETIVLVPQYLYCWIQSPQSLHRSQAPEGYDGYLRGNMAVCDNVPPAMEYERGLALKRLMLSLLASRYSVTHFKFYAPSKQTVLKLADDVAGKTVKEFVAHRGISPLFKSAMLAFWYMPFTYNLFRWALEKRAQLRR